VVGVNQPKDVYQETLKVLLAQQHVQKMPGVLENLLALIK
jgi:hypothetical protein